jgi:hypothetical protein
MEGVIKVTQKTMKCIGCQQEVVVVFNNGIAHGYCTVSKTFVTMKEVPDELTEGKAE